MSTRIFTLILNKMFTRAPKIMRDAHLPQPLNLSFAIHLVLIIVCFISYKKCVSRKKVRDRIRSTSFKVEDPSFSHISY